MTTSKTRTSVSYRVTPIVFFVRILILQSASAFTPEKQSINLTQRVAASVRDPQDFGADKDSYLWLIDPDPDPTSFCIDFKDAKNFFFFFFFF